MQSVSKVAKRVAGRPIRALANAFGYQIVKKSSVITQSGFELYQYTKPDGTFDYERYREVQTAGNKAKLGQVWAREENIAFLSEYIVKHLGPVKFGLCHGTRQGKEQEWFKKYLTCGILGTEISDNARSFPDTTLWDFHEVEDGVARLRRLHLQQLLRPQLRSRAVPEILDQLPQKGRTLHHRALGCEPARH